MAILRFSVSLFVCEFSNILKHIWAFAEISRDIIFVFASSFQIRILSGQIRLISLMVPTVSTQNDRDLVFLIVFILSLYYTSLLSSLLFV